MRAKASANARARERPCPPPSLAFALALAFALVGSIALSSTSGTSSTTVGQVEVRLGALASGSSGGANGTAGTASVTGTILSATTNLLYLNNTNATGVWLAELNVASSSGVANLPTLTIGIDNGTAQVAQVTGALGVLTKTTGTYVRLEPASANKIYVTAAVTTLGLASSVTVTVRASVDAGESAYVDTTATIGVT